MKVTDIKHKFVFLGQSVLRYEVPYDIFRVINGIYEHNFTNLPPANKQLVGKIKNEHSIFYDGEDTTKMKKHSLITFEIKRWFMSMFEHYLLFNKIRNYKTHLNSIWINEMKAHEYNPVHIHQGTLFTGLSSVMILKLPSTYGVEYSAEGSPQNGKLQILGSSSGQFSNVDYQPEIRERDFYIFPYDMRHTVYPFNGTNEVRRTLAANCDVQYNPVENRGVS
tara:strand:- start:316 stop:981 length:666 start_codon:yes stop_codon:yes gene_type:complete